MPVQPPSVFILAAVKARRGRILRKFEEAGADRPERARTFGELGVHETHLASRMVRSGVLVTADGERYFLSAEGIARWNRRRNTYILTVLGILAVLALALLWFVRGG
jgi:hypothetical protein